MRRLIVVIATVALVWGILVPDAQASTLDTAVSIGSDDAEQRIGNGAMDLTSSDLELMTDSVVQTVGLRFTNIPIPAGSTIQNAYIQFRSDETASGVTNVTIYGQDHRFPGTFTTGAFNISNRAKTTQSVAWSIPAWTSTNLTGVAQRTPDLSSIVSAIVNRGDFAAGNAMAFIFTGGGRRTADSLEDNWSPRLHVDYTAPPPPTTTTTTTTTSTTTSTTTTSTTVPPPPTSTTTTTTTAPPPPTTSTSIPCDPGPCGDVIPTGADYGFPDCFGPGRSVVTLPTRVSDPVWEVGSPPANTTYDLRGVTVTNQPSSSYPFSYGRSGSGAGAGLNTCTIGGTLRDDFGPINPGSPYTWRFVHDTYNAACMKHVGRGLHQVNGLVCRGIEDGFRPQEDQSGSTVTPNNAQFLIEDSYLGNVMDDCLENDYISAGVILDSLFEHCHNGLSERPSGDRCQGDDGIFTPPGEKLYLDHLLLGLRPVETEDDGFGYGRIFKFAKCLEVGRPQTHNDVVIRCSTFYVPEERADGGPSGGAMDVPVGTTVNDSNCPSNPTTIVWLGGGTTYPGNLRGLPIRTLVGAAGQSYWDAQVAAWHTRHPDV